MHLLNLNGFISSGILNSYQKSLDQGKFKGSTYITNTMRYQFFKTYLANTDINITRLIALDVNIQYGCTRGYSTQINIKPHFFFGISTYFVSVM